MLGLVLAALASAFAREQRRRNEIAIRPLPPPGWPCFSSANSCFRPIAWRGWCVTPRMDLKPGIFAYRLKLDRNFEITLLANLITLTPGTLSVDVSPDRKTLFVHAIDCSDPEKNRRDIAEGFERAIMEAFR